MNRDYVQRGDTIGVVLRDPGKELQAEIRQALAEGTPLILKKPSDENNRDERRRPEDH